MHASQDIRMTRCFDGLDLSFRLLKYNYEQLYDHCLKITKHKDSVIPALSLCWTFIDYGHRIREISQSVPGLKKDHTGLRKLLKATNVVEHYRHYGQHLRKELSKKNIDRFPVLGSLAWVDLLDPLQSHLVLFGSKNEADYYGCVYDRVQEKWVSRVTLGLGNKSLNFDTVFDAYEEWREIVMPWMTANYAPGIVTFDELPLMSMKVVT